jgi:hypothetical protein
VTPDQRLGQIVRALRDVGIDALVMGGHALRYYGVDRNTVDYDFFTAATSTNDLKNRLTQSVPFQGIRMGPSWRPTDFARFEIGRLPDGREEWLEFWLRNHLLPDFQALRSRQELGVYGGENVAFISLSDLLRSKETERESDWQDIALLEEIQDARNLAMGTTDEALEALLSQIRSRRGFQRALTMGIFERTAVVQRAIARCEHPVAFAYLFPSMPQAKLPELLAKVIDPVHLAPLRTAELGSAKHLAVVEIIRRSYKRGAMDADRAEKQSHLGG